MHKKQDGGFKPLWVKCQCGRWNSVQVGAVVKYLEKIIGHQDAELTKAAKRLQGEE
jgi:hypothetical protein